jgi:hypothetical protein
VRPIIMAAFMFIGVLGCKTTDEAPAASQVAAAGDHVWSDTAVKVELACEKVETMRDDDIGSFEAGDRVAVVTDAQGKRFIRHHSFGLGASRMVFTATVNAQGATTTYNGSDLEQPDRKGTLTATLDASGKGEGAWTSFGQTVSGLKCQKMDAAGQERLWAVCEKVETVQSEDIGSFERGTRVQLFTVNGTDFRAEWHDFGLGASRATFNLKPKAPAANGMTVYSGADAANAQRLATMTIKRAGQAAVGTASWNQPQISVVDGMKCQFPPQ